MPNYRAYGLLPEQIGPKLRLSECDCRPFNLCQTAKRTQCAAPEISPLTMRIILIRHGQPHIELRPRTGHAGFADYVGAYEESGLAPSDLPPQELRDLVRELDHVFTSDRPRSRQSAAALAPRAELIADPLFAEAPLAAPAFPLLTMRVPKWAVV